MNSKWSEKVDGTETRELWIWQKMNHAGVWQTFYRGKAFAIEPGGGKSQTPDDPFFHTVEEGLAWMHSE